MTGESNKGRFKCADEAQATWNLFSLAYKHNHSVLNGFKSGNYFSLIKLFDQCANDLHEARLIHGTIYDDEKRIEDKDLAHELWLSYQESGWWFNNLDGHILDIVRHKKIRGTIFYE